MNYLNKLSTAALLGGYFLLTSAESCGGVSDRVRQMNQNQEAVIIEHSVERDNINKRLALANDPTQIMWFYALSDVGTVVLSSPVVGKASSSGKRLEPKTGTIYNSGATCNIGYVAGEAYCTNEIMGADGTYGESDAYVYWFTPEGQYFQWNGKYVVSNAPLKIEKPILNVRDIDRQELERGKRAEEALKAKKKVSNSLEVEVQ
ncbi:hypothetical protein HYX13_03430 [Candidatus Woesearchaeota archaeon]|nr:hypothetical protein [Candidatus Woesearchaeota archaeon]